MSRSKILKAELKPGTHIVCITEATKDNDKIIIRFSDGKNKSVDKAYDYNSSDFIKLCIAADTKTGKEVFNSESAIGKSLSVEISDKGEVEDVSKYVAGPNAITPDKKKVIAEAREMIKQVESKVKPSAEEDDMM